MGGRGSSSSTAASSVSLSVGVNSAFATADSSTQAYHARQISELEKPEYDEGTYDLNTLRMVEYSSGYQVTFCQIGDNYSADEYADRCNEFLSLSSDGVTSAGKFEGTPEVSFNVSSLDEAVRLAKKYNQISIWDWENLREIETGGTGRR